MPAFYGTGPREQSAGTATDSDGRTDFLDYSDSPVDVALRGAERSTGAAGPRGTAALGVRLLVPPPNRLLPVAGRDRFDCFARGTSVIYRALAAGLLLTSSLWLTGCCCSRGCGPDMGCGRSYWGAYADDPPGCDPCDTCGNWIGRRCGCGRGCGRGISFPWERMRCNRGCLLTRLFGCGSSCCEPTCGNSCEPTCAPSCEPSCEVTCGEVGCGAVGGSWSGGHEQAMDAAVAPPWRSSPMRQVSSSTLHGDHKPACNCQK